MASHSFRQTDILIIGQGVAGSALAWQLAWRGIRVVVIDREEAVTASKIAAGLMTPITGRRLTRESDYDRYFQSAAEFYRRIECETGSQFFSEPQTIRLFRDMHERELFQRHRGPRDQLIDEQGRDSEIESIGFRMLPAGRLNVPEFLAVTRRWLQQTNAWHSADLNTKSDLDFSPTAVRIPSMGLTADLVVLCCGYETRPCSWFPGIPDSPVRGDILTVRIRGLKEQRVVHCGVWLVPLGNELFQVGSTYDWDHLNQIPAVAGRDEILLKLSQFIPHPVDVLDHRAAVRPAMQNQQPVAGIHPVHPRIAVLNGLGAKGSLRAPLIADELCDQLQDQLQKLRDNSDGAIGESHFGEPVVRRPSALSVDGVSSYRRVSLTRRVHDLLRELLRPGDTAIDATAGNGFDTLFLAQAVGPNGRVLAYDIQALALENTQLKLSAAGIGHVELRHESHEQLRHCGLVSKSVAAITFNLGYLPGGDKQIVTLGSASAAAVVQAAELLRPGGLMTIIAYRGHAGGRQESDTIERTVKNLGNGQFAVQRLEADSQNPNSPILFEVRRGLTDK